ncbi:hypothetical protein [Mycetocola spongiae]|uniref:hypothetical protein n=1 Tax=Mycetocola spongiae TaxID=2859226 RepID=UPI001CF3476F|nr:hypothetical protein [Mycetocola spongiae]UCR90027.1 hypothetical protein KXZ72_05005 [Mycetocola spongiae]
MTNTWMKAVTVSGLIMASTLGGTLAANAVGTLEVWDSRNFQGTVLAEGIGEVVDVGDNRAQSTINGSVFGYSARNIAGPNISEEVVYFPSGTQLQDDGAQNNKVDHFDRVG